MSSKAAIIFFSIGLFLQSSKGGQVQQITPHIKIHAEKDRAESDSVWILKQEGWRNVVYKDKNGLAVGVGHRVTPGDSLHLGDTISEWRVHKLFLSDLSRARSFVSKSFPEQPHRIISCLVGMCFNLGEDGLSQFETFVNLIHCYEYQEAAEDLLCNTLFAKQLPWRAKMIADVIQSASPDVDVAGN